MNVKHNNNYVFEPCVLNPTFKLAAMVNQLEKIVKQRRADFVKQNRPEIDDDVTINMSNCSGASSMSTVPPLRIIVHEEAHAIPKWR